LPEAAVLPPPSKPPILPPRDPRPAAHRVSGATQLAEWTAPPAAPVAAPAPPPIKQERHWWERIPVTPAHTTNDR
jgi:hypothetical protein